MRVRLGGLAEALRSAIRRDPGLLGQAKGPIVPGPRSYAVCAPCTKDALVQMAKLPKAQRAIVHPRGWLRSDLARHLRDYHKTKGT